MSASTKTVGYPVHAVARYARWTNPYGARFTTWAAHCGARGELSGHGPFGEAGSARRRELCVQCFPGQHWNAAPDREPEEVADRAAV